MVTSGDPGIHKRWGDFDSWHWLTVEIFYPEILHTLQKRVISNLDGGFISLFPDLAYLVSNLDCATIYALTITKSWHNLLFFLMHLEEKWKMRNNYLIKNRISQIKWSFIYMMLLWRHNMLLRAKKGSWLDRRILLESYNKRELKWIHVLL